MRIIVIGGGIVGSSAAYYLRRMGVDVILVDRADPGQATAAGAGIVAPGTSLGAPDAWYPLAFRAVAFYADLVAALADDGETNTGYEVVGELFVATDEAEEMRLETVRQVVEERKRAGVQNIGLVNMLSPSEARARFPALREGIPALHLSGAARVDGRLIRDALQRATARRGGTVRRGNARIQRDGQHVSGVRVNGELLPASGVILAGGAWSRELAQDTGFSLEVAPQRGQILHLEMPGEQAGTWPIVTGFHSHYMLTFPQSRVVAGATREYDTGFDNRVTAGGEYEVLGEALRVAPGLATATLIETRVGFRPICPDGLPALGSAGVEGVWVATGLGPTGLTIGPYAGHVVAALASGSPTDVDLNAYSPLRFA